MRALGLESWQSEPVPAEVATLMPGTDGLAAAETTGRAVVVPSVACTS